MSLFYCKIPVKRHSSKKNEKTIRRAGNRIFIGKNDKAAFAEHWLLMKLRELKKEMITCDVNAKYIFYYPASEYYTKKGTRNKKLNDLSNLFELPSDCLEESGIIENDTQICSFDGSCRKISDDESCWLEIELTKHQD